MANRFATVPGHLTRMSSLVPLTAAALAALLTYGRFKRLAARRQRAYWGDPRRRALADATAAAFTVIAVGWIMVATMGNAPGYARHVFILLATGVAVSQFLKSLKAPRALITIRR